MTAQDAQKKNPVILYVSECGEACDAAKGYLQQARYPHTVVDPTRSMELNKKFKDETGGEVVPVIRVWAKNGFPAGANRLASALDAAGYPKTPSFARPKPLEDRRTPTNRRRRSLAARWCEYNQSEGCQLAAPPVITIEDHHLERQSADRAVQSR